MMRSPGTQRRLYLLGAALVAVIAGVHFQQYVDFMSQVPTVGVLFLLNAAGGAGIAAALLSRDGRVRRVAATAAVGLALGSIVSIVIALQGSFFGYAEPALRLPIVLAIIAEVAVLPVLGVLLLGRIDRAGRGLGASVRLHHGAGSVVTRDAADPTAPPGAGPA